MNDGSILVLGGSGFVGRHLVDRLVASGCSVVVPTRRFDKARYLQVLPTVDVVAADVRRADVLWRLVERSAAVVNLVGILNERGRSGAGFRRVHVGTVDSLLAACRATGVRRLVHVSAINAGSGDSHYLVTKGEAEQHIRQCDAVDATIVRPSVIFGEGELRHPRPTRHERLGRGHLPWIVTGHQADEDIRVNGPHGAASRPVGGRP